MIEEQPIANAQSGDKDAFKALYEKHSASVFRVCMRLLYRRALAEEATQEVFVKVWQQLPNFDGHSKLATWIYRIAVNTAIDLLRKNRMSEAELPNSEMIQEPIGGVLGEEEMLISTKLLKL
ncbi:MAG: ECF subfamily RNA polymerase sigma-70 factor [Idiomarinaceae bacterium HL-53]|nr:MAG: ECF subfamily RNA polymerase sigma-70 factor [Idiomarinaceae bacterium HL-53]CUS48164.1 RNA polymerase sigma factor, sigma-70 family [Idiomarinaceae bacterium HL-53]